MKLPASTLKIFADYIEAQLGIIYREDNYFQLENRLQDMMRIFGLKDYDELLEKAKTGLNGQFKQVLLDVATNNETSFFSKP